MSVVLVGDTDVTHDTNVSEGAIILQKFTAVATGTMTEFQMKATSFGPGNVKVAIYTDNAGTPDALLNSVGSTAVDEGNNVITFPDTGITSGVDYWLAFNFDTAAVVAINASGGETLANEAAAFGDSFPATYPGGYTSQTWDCGIAGFGNLATGRGHSALII